MLISFLEYFLEMLIALLGEGHATWILIDKCEPTPLAFCETGASDYIEYLEDVLRTKDLAIGCIQGKLFDIFCLVIVLAFLSFFGFSIFASLCFPVFYPKRDHFSTHFPHLPGCYRMSAGKVASLAWAKPWSLIGTRSSQSLELTSFKSFLWITGVLISNSFSPIRLEDAITVTDS